MSETEKRTGRRPLPAEVAKRTFFNARLRAPLKLALEEAAAANGRSLSEEIETRLEASEHHAAELRRIGVERRRRALVMSDLTRKMFVAGWLGGRARADIWSLVEQFETVQEILHDLGERPLKVVPLMTSEMARASLDRIDKLVAAVETAKRGRAVGKAIMALVQGAMREMEEFEGGFTTIETSLELARKEVRGRAGASQRQKKARARR